MLKNTFCHLPGITVSREKELWSSGVHSWDALLDADASLCRKRAESVSDLIKSSVEHLRKDNPDYFARALPSSLHWRLFPEFRDSIAYLDIETTGLGHGNSITTIAVYDGKEISTYVQSKNLDDFKKDIKKYKVIVTYNGKSFDVPFIERYFDISMDQPNIDLMFILRRLGYSGGLKACERKLGIARNDLADVDGYAAVLLWSDYKRNKNQKALETLLAYNVLDVLNLETLLVMAYNMNLATTPFQESHKQAMPSFPKIPFEPDKTTLRRILRG